MLSTEASAWTSQIHSSGISFMRVVSFGILRFFERWMVWCGPHFPGSFGHLEPCGFLSELRDLGACKLWDTGTSGHLGHREFWTFGTLGLWDTWDFGILDSWDSGHTTPRCLLSLSDIRDYILTTLLLPTSSHLHSGDLICTNVFLFFNSDLHRRKVA